MRNQKRTLVLIFTCLMLTGSACNSLAIPQSSTTIESPTVINKVPVTESIKQPVTATALPIHSELKQVSGSYLFAEGPATDVNGNVYFSDINAGKIYKWMSDGSVTVFVDGLKSPNGSMFDKDGNLIVCEGGNGRLISINPLGQITVLVDQYNGKRFNEPNDLWIDPQGGIYFTDPVFQSPVVQDGEYVYYLSPDRSQTTRVISDLVKPNGIVGTPDGRNLYVADYGGNKTYSYSINSDGTLINKKLFVAVGSDGMDLDAAGNVYLTTPNKVQVFDVRGNHLQDIPTPENPTNVAFTGKDGLTLFITARTLVFTLQLSPAPANVISTPSQTQTFTLRSPDLPSDGRLPVEYTCDGNASTLALAWSDAPAGTRSFAVIMHHVASPTDIHWYWVLYNIPANVNSLGKNITGVGTLGTNSVTRRNEYTPPCSKGPGDKMYTYTVYALSALPQLSVSASQVNRAVLLDAIKNITLASAELHVVYARP